MADQLQTKADDSTSMAFEQRPEQLDPSRPSMYRGVVELAAPETYLADTTKIQRLIEHIVDAFDFNVMDYGETEFEPYGITAYVVIGESHVSIHTWPEHEYAHVELLTCVPIPDQSQLRRQFPVRDDYILEVRSDAE